MVLLFSFYTVAPSFVAYEDICELYHNSLRFGAPGHQNEQHVLRILQSAGGYIVYFHVKTGSLDLSILHNVSITVFCKQRTEVFLE